MRKEVIGISLAGLLLVSCARAKAEETSTPSITLTTNPTPFEGPTLDTVMEELRVQGPCLTGSNNQELRDRGLATGVIDWPTFGPIFWGFNSMIHTGLDIAGEYNRPINAAGVNGEYRTKHWTSFTF